MKVSNLPFSGLGIHLTESAYKPTYENPSPKPWIDLSTMKTVILVRAAKGNRKFIMLASAIPPVERKTPNQIHSLHEPLILYVTPFSGQT